MSWRRWRLGLGVAIVMGCFDGILVALVDPAIRWKALLGLVLYWIAKDGGLFLTNHPVDKIVFGDTEIITKPPTDEQPTKLN